MAQDSRKELGIFINNRGRRWCAPSNSYPTLTSFKIRVSCSFRSLSLSQDAYSEATSSTPRTMRPRTSYELPLCITIVRERTRLSQWRIQQGFQLYLPRNLKLIYPYSSELVFKITNKNRNMNNLSETLKQQAVDLGLCHPGLRRGATATSRS